MVCILDNLSKKWLKMAATAVHLLTNSSEIKVVSNFNKPYSSEGVPTLNVASKVEFPKSLWFTLQSHKVQEAKMADFWPFSRPAHSQKTVHQVSKLINKTAHPKMMARAKPLCRYTEINDS